MAVPVSGYTVTTAKQDDVPQMKTPLPIDRRGGVLCGILVG